MNMINMEKISDLSLNQSPYCYKKIINFLEPEIFSALCKTYPEDGFVNCETLMQEKTYSMFMKQLYDSRTGLDITQELSEPWSTFLLELLSEQYISIISNHAQRDLTTCDIEINCWRYPNGGWLAPHTDKPEKIVSQLFYFNTIWDKAWGGSLNILNSNDNNDIHEEIFPDNNTSIILVRSENSWHSVAPLNCPPDISRRLLQIIFWDKQ